MPPTEAEFDKFHTEYQRLLEDSMRFSRMSHDYVTKAKVDLIKAAVQQHYGSLEGRRVLDIGCGIGLTDSFLIDQPWQLAGTDVSAKSIEQARSRNPQVDYVVSDEDRLPFDDASFDLCFTICVMHHVPPANWTEFLREMNRVLKPDGIAIVIEHNPLNPLTRLVVNRCPFDADAVLLNKRKLVKHLRAAELQPLHNEYFLFTPWRRLRFLDRMFRWLPLGAQYCMVATK